LVIRVRFYVPLPIFVEAAGRNARDAGLN
jgi:hypothetical protein